MRHENLTFSIPADLKMNLQTHVAARGVSKFISDAIRKALEKEKLKSETSLDEAYAAANKDVDRLETLQKCNQLDNFNDLIEDDENWDWLKK